MKVQELYDKVLSYFAEAIPVAETELDYENPFQLLIAVILSAQCTDKRVNMVTPDLFARYDTPEELAAAHPDEVYNYIKSISYPNNKAKHLVGMAQKLVGEFGGEVPDTLEELVKLPGVGRKTANVVCAVIWNQPTMAVDTHIFRVSERLGLTTHSRTPRQTEDQLVRYIPQDIIPKAHHWLLLHGRYVCQARKPKCEQCGLQPYCRYFAKK